MSTSLAINCKSYVILDFENNYIYIDNSDKFVNRSVKEYKIDCFFDIERNIRFRQFVI